MSPNMFAQSCLGNKSNSDFLKANDQIGAAVDSFFGAAEKGADVRGSVIDGFKVGSFSAPHFPPR
jgi:hypothetical protein